MIAAVLRAIRPFNRPRPVTLACAPVLSSRAPSAAQRCEAPASQVEPRRVNDGVQSINATNTQGNIYMTISLLQRQAARAVSPILDIDPAPAARDLGIAEGRMTIDPALAARILAETNYVRQRKIKPFRLHRHKVTILRDQWDPDNTIRFASFGKQLVMVDGQHRLTGVYETGVPCAFIVVITPVKTWDEVHRLYSRIDVDGNRSAADVLNAADPTAGRSVSFEMRRGAYRAMDALANDFPHRKLKVGEAELITKEDRVNCMAFWLDELEEYDQIVRSAQSTLRNPMRKPGVIAVALATLKHQHDRAQLFWTRVAENKLLRPGDPEQALVNFLLTSRLDDAPHQAERYSAMAWDRWFRGHRLDKIRKSANEDRPIKIAGTPFQGLA
jgi:hypothetical protein